MHVEHTDSVLVGERSKSHRRAAKRGDQRQLTSKFLAELVFVIGHGSPSVLLGFAIVVDSQLRDVVKEKPAPQRPIGRQHRPQSELWMRLRHHRAISQVVPSFESFSTTPMAASSSRIRSDSLKFLALRAAVRASMRLMTLASSMTRDAGRNEFHAEADICSRPSKRPLAFRQAAAGFTPFAPSAPNS